VYAAHIKRPFSVKYDPYTYSIELLDHPQKICHSLTNIPMDVSISFGPCDYGTRDQENGSRNDTKGHLIDYLKTDKNLQYLYPRERQINFMAHTLSFDITFNEKQQGQDIGYWVHIVPTSSVLASFSLPGPVPGDSDKYITVG
ncbi:hypothetical protein L345_16143, partial [Ophiophagus hannah]